MAGQTQVALPGYPFEMGPYGSSTLAYDRFRKSTPVCRVSLQSGFEAWLVTRYADVCAVLKDPTFSRSEAVRVGASLVKDAAMELEAGVLQNTEGAEHSRLRSVFASHYSPGHASHWAEIIRTEAHGAIDRLRSGKTFDLRADILEAIGNRCAEKFFGLPVYHGPQILELYFDEKIMLDLRGRLASLVRNEDRHPDCSYLGLLCAACRNGNISEAELVANLMVFATVTFQGLAAPFLGGVFALLRNYDQWESCLREPSLVPNAVDEMLRCYPNGDGQFLRIAMADVVLSGVRIRRGDAVLAPAPAANTDPEIFTEPRRFDVRRPNSNKHVAFGIGRHRCLGSSLVETWMRTVLTVLLDRLPSLRLAATPETIRYVPHPLINIMESLPVMY
jgi:cytochrome P450